MPPSLGESLPEDHLVWMVLGTVEQMDWAGLRKRIGWVARVGRRYDPAMLVALLLYAYARGAGPRRGSSGGAGRTSPTR
jgi:hypothetical protein